MKKILLFALVILSFSTTAQIPSYIPTNGLIGWWPFTGNANDSSGNNNNGTVMGATPTTDRFGNDSSAYLFDGTSSYITVPSSASLESPTVGFTVSAWTYLNGYSLVGQPFDPIITKSDNSANAFMYRFTVDINGIGYYAGTNNWTTNTGAAYQFSLGEWHLLTAVLDSFYSYLYLDDSLIATNSFTTAITVNNLPLEFGRDMPGVMEVFNGKLDDIAIWNRALSHEEITGAFNSCTLTVTAQPVSASGIEGTSTQFTVAASDTTALYQWQSDTGSGYTNLSNGGQYAGTANDTLTVSGLLLSNDGDAFRCIISSGACTDTSDEVTLSVLPNGIADVMNEGGLLILKNPVSDNLYLWLGDAGNYEMKIYNLLGQPVAVKKISLSGNQSMNADISALPSGNYIVMVTGMDGNHIGRFVKE